MKIIISILLTIFFINCISQTNNEEKIENSESNEYLEHYLQNILSKNYHNYIPDNGIIPDENTAISIAEIILKNIYGEKTIEEERPFHANLVGNYWIIFGSLPPNTVGGVAEIVINKNNGEVINISHSK